MHKDSMESCMDLHSPIHAELQHTQLGLRQCLQINSSQQVQQQQQYQFVLLVPIKLEGGWMNSGKGEKRDSNNQHCQMFQGCTCMRSTLITTVWLFHFVVRWYLCQLVIMCVQYIKGVTVIIMYVALAPCSWMEKRIDQIQRELQSIMLVASQACSNIMADIIAQVM